MRVAVIGLGKMGSQFVKKLSADGIEIIAYDMNQALIEAAQADGVTTATSREDAITKFSGDEPVVWLMIPANAVEEELVSWKSLLPRNSVLIDGGNSDFRQSQVRAQQFADQGVRYVDVGVSGGVLGESNGFSFMVGGQLEAYNLITPIFRSLAAPNGSYNYMGPSGSGHFVKMVHNAVEYGVMESLAEGYNLLKSGPFNQLNLALIADTWQHGSIVESRLNDLALQVFNENPNLDGIVGSVAETGETNWALEVAQQSGINLPAIQAAVDVRQKSQTGQVSFATKLLAALRNKFGGHSENPQ